MSICQRSDYLTTLLISLAVRPTISGGDSGCVYCLLISQYLLNCWHSPCQPLTLFFLSVLTSILAGFCVVKRRLRLTLQSESSESWQLSAILSSPILLSHFIVRVFVSSDSVLVLELCIGGIFSYRADCSSSSLPRPESELGEMFPPRLSAPLLARLHQLIFPILFSSLLPSRDPSKRYAFQKISVCLQNLLVSNLNSF